MTKQRAFLKKTTAQTEEKAFSEDSQPQYIYLPEYTSEHMYSFLLSRLICFNDRLRQKIAYWRQYVEFLDKIQMKITKFHIPELQDKWLPYIFDDLKKGNT